MIIEYIRYHIPEGTQAAFEEAYTQAQSALMASAHCLGWDVAHCMEQPEHYVVRLLWDSVDGHTQGFRHSAEFQAFFAAIRPYVNEIDEMQHYQPTSIQHLKAN